jgi:hypothetical protein
MFIRFVVHRLDQDSGRRQGLFQAAKELRQSGELSPHDHARLEEIGDWFDLNLKKPSRLSLSSRPHAKAQAISWFKDTAAEHVRNMRQIGSILETYGLVVVTIRTQRPGYVVYEDDFQVAAYPFNDTGA